MTKAEYHKPPEHIQLLEIANTPPWLRVRLRKEAVEEVFKELDKWCLGSMVTGKNIFGLELEQYRKIKAKFLSPKSSRREKMGNKHPKNSLILSYFEDLEQGNMTKEDIVGALESHFDDIQKEEFDRVHNKWIELIENKDEVFDMSLEFTAWMIEQDEKLSPVSAKVNRKGVVVEDYVEHLLNLGNCECKYHCDANKTVIKCDSCKSASMHNEQKDMDGHWNCGVCNCSHKFKSNARECCALITKTDKSANQKEDE